MCRPPSRSFCLANTVLLAEERLRQLSPEGPPYYLGIGRYVYVAEPHAEVPPACVALSPFQASDVRAAEGEAVLVRAVPRPIWITCAQLTVAPRRPQADLAVPADYVRAALRGLRGRVLSVGQTLPVEVFLPDGGHVLAARVTGLGGATADRLLEGEAGEAVATGVLSAASRFELASTPPRLRLT